MCKQTIDQNGEKVTVMLPVVKCPVHLRPEVIQKCLIRECPKLERPKWIVEDWSEVRLGLMYCIEAIPYHTIPYHTIPYHTIPYHTIPYHTIPYHTIPYHTIPYHPILISFQFNFITIKQLFYILVFSSVRPWCSKKKHRL